MIQKKFIAEQDYFPDMVKFLKDVLLEIQIKEFQMKKILVIAEEALVNVINYAYKTKLKDRVDNYVKIIIFINDLNELILKIEDEGIDYNFNENKAGPLKKHQIGGLGIFFIKEMADDAVHRREGSKNILEIKVKDVK